MGQIEKFKDQSYGRLKRKFMDSKELFTDPLFPPNDNSLSLNKPVTSGKIVWKRPSELVEVPKLFVEKASSKDVTQGKLGNCWFVAACSALATCKPLWSVVVPDYKLQEWDPIRPELYAGIFHFRFWRFGKWVDVVIDDYLPTIDGELLFCSSSTSNEFWSALLEKAYAKLCGSYGAMDGGNLCDALVDFTSGLAEMILLKEGYTEEPKKTELRKTLLKEFEDHAMMCCAIGVSDSSLFETRTRTGLVVGHAYGITAVKELHVGNSGGLLSFFRSGEKITLLRLRNPWGSKEWNGAFSDGVASDDEVRRPGSCSKSFSFPDENSDASTSQVSKFVYVYSPEELIHMNSRSSEWSTISKSDRDKLGLTFEDDGEFWMPFDDFVTEFTDLSICRLINTSAFSFKKSWYESMVQGEWTTPDRAGGCINNETSFLQNPQYYFDVPQHGMEIEAQLLQTDLRGKMESLQRGRVEYKSIGFHIMLVEKNRMYRVHKIKEKAASSDYVKGRSVFFRGTLNKGRYVILPTTFEPNVQTEFLLRLYTESKIKLCELESDYPEPSWFCRLCCRKTPPTCVTVVRVEGATGLSREMDTYCIIKIENESLKSGIARHTNSPVWDLNGIFYRRDICQPFKVEIWEHRMVKDKFVGSAIITGCADNHTASLRCPIVGRGKRKDERQPGDVQLVVTTYDEPDAA